jgi:hypothetical protein
VCKLQNHNAPAYAPYSLVVVTRYTFTSHFRRGGLTEHFQILTHLSSTDKLQTVHLQLQTSDLESSPVSKNGTEAKPAHQNGAGETKASLHHSLNGHGPSTEAGPPVRPDSDHGDDEDVAVDGQLQGGQLQGGPGVDADQVPSLDDVKVARVETNTPSDPSASDQLQAPPVRQDSGKSVTTVESLVCDYCGVAECFGLPSCL